MSAALREILNEDGVLLRYATDVRGPHHDAKRIWPSDRLRMVLLRAERQLPILELIVEHMDPSSVATDRTSYALRSIQAVFTLARAELGLYVPREVEE